MDMRVLLVKFLFSIIEIGSAVLITLLQRWLFGLSTIENDIRWLNRLSMWDAIVTAKWYRGAELLHQIRAKKILRGAL